MADAIEQRRLAAIMFTDMVGYSALTQRNEALALALVAEQQRLLRPILAQHGGREVKGTGDGYLVEFASALQAVSCAIDMQKAMVEYNSSAAPERRIQIRIGLHLGDVVVRDGDVFGDGVNIAARIEPLADAGGICMTRPVHDQVHNKIDLPLVLIGQPQLKNIQAAIDVYRVVLPWTQGAPARSRQRTSAKTSRLPGVAAVLATLLVIAGVITWRYQQPAATTPQASPSPVAPTPSTHAADRKSVAVLPFVNMSGNDADEYLSDGMSEEIITALSKVGGLRVAARTSSFFFKGKNEAIEKIGEQLHVGSVLEGSVRKAGPKLRVTAQLINTGDGYHLWSETYDEDTADILAIESDVAQRVAGALKITLLGTDAERLRRKSTENPEAHQLYLKGRYYVSRFTEDGLKKGRGYLEQAIALDPNYALAYQGLAYHYLVASDWFAANKDVAAPWRTAAERALQIDPTLAEAHTFLATLYGWYDWNWSAADDEYKRALAIDPDNVVAHEYFGQHLVLTGRIPEGIAEGRRATAIDPLSAAATAFLGADFYFAHRYDDAIAQLSEAVELDPSYWYAHHYLGRSLLQKGDVDRGLAELRRAKELSPHNPEGIATLGVAFAMVGDRAAAYAAIDELRQHGQRSYVAAYDYAVIYAALHETDQAIAWITQAYDDRSGYIQNLKAGPELDPLRSDPRFTALLKKVGLGE